MDLGNQPEVARRLNLEDVIVPEILPNNVLVIAEDLDLAQANLNVVQEVVVDFENEVVIPEASNNPEAPVIPAAPIIPAAPVNPIVSKNPEMHAEDANVTEPRIDVNFNEAPDEVERQEVCRPDVEPPSAMDVNPLESKVKITHHAH